MSVSKIMGVCWVVFSVMCVAFVPVGFGIGQLHALPVAVRVVLAVLVIGGLWWGPFVYAMYLSLAVVRNGDRRLLRRGIAGTAQVLTAACAYPAWICGLLEGGRAVCCPGCRNQTALPLIIDP